MVKLSCNLIFKIDFNVKKDIEMVWGVIDNIPYDISLQKLKSQTIRKN